MGRFGRSLDREIGILTNGGEVSRDFNCEIVLGRVCSQKLSCHFRTDWVAF